MKHFNGISEVYHKIIARSCYSWKFNSLLLYINANVESLWSRWAHHLSIEKFTSSQCAHKFSLPEQLLQVFLKYSKHFLPTFCFFFFFFFFFSSSPPFFSLFPSVLFRFQIHTSGRVSGVCLYFVSCAWCKTFKEFITRKCWIIFFSTCSSIFLCLVMFSLDMNGGFRIWDSLTWIGKQDSGCFSEQSEILRIISLLE